MAFDENGKIFLRSFSAINWGSIGQLLAVLGVTSCSGQQWFSKIATVSRTQIGLYA